MKIPKRSILLSALLASSAWVMAEMSPGVTFLLKSGQKVSFAFTERPVVMTAADVVSVSTDGVERVSYAYSDVQRILFGEGVPTGISLPQAGGVSDYVSHAVFCLSNGGLRASGLKAGERLDIYSLSGSLVVSAKAGADGVAALHLSSLPKGVLIVRTQGGVSYKLMNR